LRDPPAQTRKAQHYIIFVIFVVAAWLYRQFAQ
jgi:hypothetical protein